MSNSIIGELKEQWNRRFGNARIKVIIQNINLLLNDIMSPGTSEQSIYNKHKLPYVKNNLPFNLYEFETSIVVNNDWQKRRVRIFKQSFDEFITRYSKKKIKHTRYVIEYHAGNEWMIVFDLTQPMEVNPNVYRHSIWVDLLDAEVKNELRLMERKKKRGTKIRYMDAPD